ncbi:MAG: hypothetical protein FJZ57_02405 [Chlamydiae bacterium]|nr:hypothetical protein [Chlamydiota bacterium]
MSTKWQILLSIILSSKLLSNETLCYQSVTEKNAIDTEWKIESVSTGFNIEGISSNKSTSSLKTDKDFFLENFIQKDPAKGYDIEAKRTGSTLTISAKDKKGQRTKTYDIGSTPWVQEFTFGFKDFLNSKKNEYKFEILHPKNLEIHDMIATKESLEDVTIDGKEYNTQKLKITLQGFKKRFWKAEVWYDTTTKNLIRYKANEGPGTPITELIFIEKK